VALVEKIGADRGVKLEISKNLKNVTIERDITNMITRLYPYGKDDAHIGSVNNNIQYIDSLNTALYGVREGYRDYSDYVEPSDILAHAQWEFNPDNEERIDVPEFNISGDFIDLSKLKGIGVKTFEKIKDKIITNFALMDLVIEFKNVLSMSIIKKIYDEYSSIDKLKEKLKAQPYTTLTRISRIGFKTADSIVLQLQKENIIDFGFDVKTSFGDSSIDFVKKFIKDEDFEKFMLAISSAKETMKPVVTTVECISSSELNEFKQYTISIQCVLNHFGQPSRFQCILIPVM
jgi:hypothetical protein